MTWLHVRGNVSITFGAHGTLLAGREIKRYRQFSLLSMAVSHLSPEDIQAIIDGVSSSRQLVTGVAAQLKEAMATPASLGENVPHNSQQHQGDSRVEARVDTQSLGDSNQQQPTGGHTQATTPGSHAPGYVDLIKNIIPSHHYPPSALY